MLKYTCMQTKSLSQIHLSDPIISRVNDSKLMHVLIL